MKNLTKPSMVERFAASDKPNPEAVRIERTGGRYSAGVISGVSLCSRGEALGHGMWCDSVFLEQIVECGNSNLKPLKSRFAHPGLCSDGIGKSLGTIEGLHVVGDQSLGDFHFYASAHKTPDGDLANYVMDLAEEDPVNFGLSIVFTHDQEAEQELLTENGAKLEATDEGVPCWNMDGFTSPDPGNINNLPHARIAELRACDVVDDPAANPGGLFHRQDAMLSQASNVIDFVLGKSEAKPAFSAFGAEISIERVKDFFNSRLAAHGLTITEKGGSMSVKTDEKPVEPTEKQVETEPDGDEKQAEVVPADPKKDGEEPCSDEEKKCETKQSEKSDLEKFCMTFGHEAGAKYLLEGITFEQAQSKHIAELSAKLKDAEGRLSAFAQSGVDPVPFSAAPGSKGEEKPKSNREAFAAAIASSKN